MSRRMSRMSTARIVCAMTAGAVLAGCSTANAPNADVGGEPQKGGILQVGSNGDIDRMDPGATAYVPTASVMRAITRQLLSYESVADEAERIKPKGDLATEAPEPTNDGKTYTYKLRDGIQWDLPGGAREITATDVERGLKRICNPVLGSPHTTYFVSLVEGMDTFCDGFAKVAPQAGPMKEYVEKTDISGITQNGDKEVTFTLKEAAGDFPYMLTLFAASPAPVEVLDHVPDSPEYRNNFVASGPYRIKSYSPDNKLELERNQNWKPESDPLRKANVDGVVMTMGLSSDAVTQQLQAGSLDLPFDTSVSPTVAAQMRATNDTKLSTLPSGAVNPFLWINTKSPNNNGAMNDLKVRQALQYAIDRAGVIQILGGNENASPQHGIFGPGVLGFHEFDLYPTPNDQGDPEKAKQLLSEAGFPNGITLKMPYRTKDQEPAIAQTIQASLQKAGFTIELTPVNPTDYYSKFLTNRSSTASGVWDIAPVGWTPDWQGGAARSVFQPQFTFTGTPQVYNYVDYNNDEANKLAAQAIAATSPEEAGKLWGQVDEAVMKDAVVVPIAAPKAILYHSARVQNFVPFALSVQGDWTNLWLNQ